MPSEEVDLRKPGLEKIRIKMILGRFVLVVGLSLLVIVPALAASGYDGEAFQLPETAMMMSGDEFHGCQPIRRPGSARDWHGRSL